MKVTRDNRTLHLSELPQVGDDIVRRTVAECPQMSISVRYVGEGNVRMGIILDNVVMPLLVEALERTP